MLHYYNHNIGDYRRDTAHLTLLEHGVYRQLLDQYYLDEAPIEKDLNKIHRYLQIKTEEEKNALTNVLQDFFMETENGYVHKRCDDTIQEYQKKSEVASKAAKARWDKESMRTHTGRIPDAMQTNNHKPITINHKPDYDIQFDAFWIMYPKKVGKEAARKAWLKNKPDIDAVIKAIQWQEVSSQWKKGYIPNPSTYINQHRWLDEPEEVGF
jgi:uncharacterized protein YdaU (DUF1376 family)